jgi:hypothetical protein
MDETTRLTNYYKQMQVIEEKLIQAKQVGDMMNVLLIETEKLKTWDAIK